MAFDPDKFLADRSGSAFDPDAFLNSRSEPKYPRPLKVLKGLGSEIKAIGGFAKGAAKEGLLLFVENAVLGASDPLTLQKNKKRGEIAAGIIKSSPSLLRESVADTARSFGSENLSAPKVEVFSRKLEESPLSTLSDWFILTGAAKKVGLGAIKKGAKLSRLNKKEVLTILKKSDIKLKEINRAAKEIVPTELDELVEKKELISKIPQQNLDNVNFAKNLGNKITEGFSDLEKRDRLKLDFALKKIKDVEVDKQAIMDDALIAFREGGLVNKNDVLIPALNKPLVTKEIENLRSGNFLSAGELKKRINIMDKNITWKDPKELDNGLIALRRAYRKQLRIMSGEYDTKALEVAGKLDKLEPRLRSLKKLGAGERLGKNLFSSKEELAEVKNVLDRSPEKISGKILGDIEVLEGWQAYNNFANQNKNLIFKNVPSFATGFIPPILQEKITRRAIRKRVTGGPSFPKLSPLEAAIGLKASSDIPRLTPNTPRQTVNLNDAVLGKFRKNANVQR